LPSFYFPSHSHLPDLHPFPTRRSSDLSRWPSRYSRSKSQESGALAGFPDRSSQQCATLWRLGSSTSAATHSGPTHWLRTMILCRSEEHTSELQSRSDLVCRLLLEKKKK